MTETTLTVTSITKAGVTPTLAAANSGGSSFANDSSERVFLRAKNTDGSTATVTIVAQQTPASVPGVGSVTVPDIAVIVAATTGDVLIGPIPPAYIDSSGLSHVTYSSVTALTVAAFKLARVANG